MRRGDGNDRLTLEPIAEADLHFRAANEAIRAAAEEYAVTMPVPFLCECVDETCVQIVRLGLDEYRSVRAKPQWFLNAPGHELAAGGATTVVSEHPAYVVVEKPGVR